MEYPYRPVAEFDLRVADVAAISRDRWISVNPDDNLGGAPELVVEARPSSNTARQLREQAALCLPNGCIEFWIVDSGQPSVTVVRRAGDPIAFRSGEQIPLDAFGGAALAVGEIFA